MQEFLLGTWGGPVIAYGQHYPWRVFAIGLVVTLVIINLTSTRNRSGSGDGGDFGLLDFGDSDGDGGCGGD
jgi:hypothetical protein